MFDQKICDIGDTYSHAEKLAAVGTYGRIWKRHVIGKAKIMLVTCIDCSGSPYKVWYELHIFATNTAKHHYMCISKLEKALDKWHKALKRMTERAHA